MDLNSKVVVNAKAMISKSHEEIGEMFRPTNVPRHAKARVQSADYKVWIEYTWEA